MKFEGVGRWPEDQIAPLNEAMRAESEIHELRKQLQHQLQATETRILDLSPVRIRTLLMAMAEPLPKPSLDWMLQLNPGQEARHTLTVPQGVLARAIRLTADTDAASVMLRAVRLLDLPLALGSKGAPLSMLFDGISFGRSIPMPVGGEVFVHLENRSTRTVTVRVILRLQDEA